VTSVLVDPVDFFRGFTVLLLWPESQLFTYDLDGASIRQVDFPDGIRCIAAKREKHLDLNVTSKGLRPPYGENGSNLILVLI